MRLAIFEWIDLVVVLGKCLRSEEKGSSHVVAVRVRLMVVLVSGVEGGYDQQILSTRWSTRVE